MKKGAYYLMGGSQVKPLKTMLRSLLSATQKSTPHVLYIEAAGNTDPNLINGFLGNLRRNFDDISYDALNLYLQQPNAIGTKPENIKATFEKADIVFFEGGNLNILTELFQKHGLKDLCRTAFEKGAYVGGICAGGLILLDQIIYENNHGRITTMPGIGLVPSVAASCYIYDSDSGAERRDVLRGLSDTRLTFMLF